MSLKKIAVLSGVVATAIASFGEAKAAVLFNDNYTTSAQSIDVNFEIVGGVRQSGTRATQLYSDNGDPFGDGYRTQVNEGHYPNALLLFPGGLHPELVASPNYNFNQDGAVITVSADLLTGNTGDPLLGGDYTGLTIGGNGVGARAYTDVGFGVILRPHFTGVSGQDNYQVFYNGNFLVGGNSAAISSSLNSVVLSISAAAFDNTPAIVTASINNTLLYTGTQAGGFSNNFVTLSAADFQTPGNNLYGFDNLNVSTVVPEPASLGLLCTATLGLLARRRRAAAK